MLGPRFGAEVVRLQGPLSGPIGGKMELGSGNGQQPTLQDIGRVHTLCSKGPFRASGMRTPQAATQIGSLRPGADPSLRLHPWLLASFTEKQVEPTEALECGARAPDPLRPGGTLGDQACLVRGGCQVMWPQHLA